MLRTALADAVAVDHHGFRIRSREVSRLEGLSDAVFGFAITLLVVSLEVPETFDELMGLLRGFVAFAASFAILVIIWYEHYTFFRRYGFEDLWIIIFNLALLFVVVLYIYPLKFLFSAVIGQMVGGTAGVVPLRRADGPALMTIYSVSIIAVFGLLTAMYAHAYRRRARLQLDEAEVLLTRSNLRYYAIWIGIAVFSIALSHIGGPEWVPLAGMSYGLLGPLQAINGYVVGRRVSRMRES